MGGCSKEETEQKNRAQQAGWMCRTAALMEIGTTEKKSCFCHMPTKYCKHTYFKFSIVLDCKSKVKTILGYVASAARGL